VIKERIRTWYGVQYILKKMKLEEKKSSYSGVLKSNPRQVEVPEPLVSEQCPG